MNSNRRIVSIVSSSSAELLCYKRPLQTNVSFLDDCEDLESKSLSHWPFHVYILVQLKFTFIFIFTEVFIHFMLVISLIFVL